MIVMNLEIDNLFAFRKFKVNFSHSMKGKDSAVTSEYLKTKPSFRYKKVNIIIGTNASGKTSLGKALKDIFNFIKHHNILAFQDDFLDETKLAYFSIDFLLNEECLYRIDCSLSIDKVEELNIYRAEISENDSYETCSKKLVEIQKNEENYNLKLDTVSDIGWSFVFPQDENSKYKIENYRDPLYLDILRNVLKTLDPSITEIVNSKELSDSYIIKSKNGDMFVQKGEVNKNILSTGTKAGLRIADLIFEIHKDLNGFYYCDEQFSFIQSDIEKSILSLMISLLSDNAQLFFTTHNLDILDMNLPIHSFMFLKKDDTIEVVYPEKKLKNIERMTLREAVENDVFDVSPSLENIFLIEEMCIESLFK